VPSIEDVRVMAATLPGSEERATTGGAAWFVGNKVYAWQAHPWPSIPAEVRAIIAEESVVMVKVASEEDKLAYREGWPEVFLPQTAAWSEPKVAFRLDVIDPDLLDELIAEAWYSQAPRYLRREFDEPDDVK